MAAADSLSKRTSAALHWCLPSYIALSVLVPVWYAVWFPSRTGLQASAALLAAGWLMLAIARNGRWTYAGMVALLLFIHGLTEAMVTPAERIPALLTTGLSLSYFLGLWLQVRAWRAAGVRPRRRGVQGAAAPSTPEAESPLAECADQQTNAGGQAHVRTDAND